jgi:hypothetical protein
VVLIKPDVPTTLLLFAILQATHFRVTEAVVLSNPDVLLMRLSIAMVPLATYAKTTEVVVLSNPDALVTRLSIAMVLLTTFARSCAKMTEAVVLSVFDVLLKRLLIAMVLPAKLVRMYARMTGAVVLSNPDVLLKRLVIATVPLTTFVRMKVDVVLIQPGILSMMHRLIAMVLHSAFGTMIMVVDLINLGGPMALVNRHVTETSTMIGARTIALAVPRVITAPFPTVRRTMELLTDTAADLPVECLLGLFTEVFNGTAAEMIAFLPTNLRETLAQECPIIMTMSTGSAKDHLLIVNLIQRDPVRATSGKDRSTTIQLFVMTWNQEGILPIRGTLTKHQSAGSPSIVGDTLWIRNLNACDWLSE